MKKHTPMIVEKSTPMKTVSGTRKATRCEQYGKKKGRR